MSEKKIFTEIMEEFNVFFRIIYSYQNVPRTYGTDDLLLMSEAHMIEMIGNNPGLNLNELAEKTHRTKSSASIMLKSLVKKKLIKRKRDIEDNRRYIINLTDKGQIIFDFHEELDDTNYREILQSINDITKVTEEDLNKFKIFLKNYNKVISERAAIASLEENILF